MREAIGLLDIGFKKTFGGPALDTRVPLTTGTLPPCSPKDTNKDSSIMVIIDTITE
jgi:hypothetical protein